MTTIVPATRPKQLRTAAVDQLLAEHAIAQTTRCLIGVRGYYQNSMGESGVNDVGIYDDAMILCGPGLWLTFNANTDPSKLFPKVAVLEPGLWHYRIGIHGLSKPPAQRYKALVQAQPVTVRRFGGGLETGMFGINIHRGSYAATSSLGCQTIYPSQWAEFIGAVEESLRPTGQTIIPYLLIPTSDL